MTSPANPDQAQTNHLLDNILHFARLLRRLGFLISTRQVIDLAEGLTYIDLYRYDDVFTASRSLLVIHPDDLDRFKAAFDLFWAGRLSLEVAFGSQGKPDQQTLDELDSQPAKGEGQQTDFQLVAEEDQPAAEALAEGTSMTYSPAERLYHKDFSALSDEEVELVKRIMQTLVWRLDKRLTRRRSPALKQADFLDLRRSLRGSLKQGGEIFHLDWKKRKPRPRPLVMICDISGSMETYSRLFLHFMYALSQTGQHTEAFAFGTRLTRITPAMRNRNIDEAIDRAADLVIDWSGGTRIGQSLRRFNYDWGRRVLRRGAVVLVISDGWDRGDVALLEQEVARLSRSCSRLIWLNPLLGAASYEPLVRGIQAVLPYVDDFLPLHNLASMESLAAQLGQVAPR